MAGYTRCLRCAGAHRRPASGSGLSLLIPSWHAALSDLGEFDHRFGPEHRCRHWPSLWTKGLGTPNNPAIRFARGTVFAATLVRDCYGLSGCWPPCTDLTSLPANGGFYFQAFDGSVTLPVAGYNYNSVWTPLLTGLSPAGIAASLAALARPCSCPARRKVLRGIKKHKEHVPCHTSPHHPPSARSASISVRIASILWVSINAGRSFGNSNARALNLSAGSPTFR